MSDMHLYWFLKLSDRKQCVVFLPSGSVKLVKPFKVQSA